MSDSSLSVSARPSGYHDFGGLAGLRGEAAQGSDGALHETAKQFETYFIQQVMKTMRDSIEKSELTDNPDADMFQDLMDKEVAAKMAERGSLGLARMIEQTMAQRMPVAPPSTQDVLAARGAMPLAAPAQAVPLAGEAATPRALPRSGGPMSLDSGLYGRQPSNTPPAPAAASQGGEP